MSRIGKKPISCPDGVTVGIEGGTVRVKGPKGELSRPLPDCVTVSVDGATVQVDQAGGGRRGRAMHGLARALIQNMVTGTSQGFVRSLEINGVGYRAEVKGRILSLVLGYSHPIEVMLPDGIDAKVDRNRIDLMGIDKEAVGQLAAIIRSQRPPEPYKGKGIRYVDEHVRRKVGKSGAA